MASANNELLTVLLKEVSRSFYLTLRVLPKSVRSQIGLAYLLARTTDTIADTEIVAVEQRLKMLQALRERILGVNSVPLNFGELAQQQGSPAERVLLEKCEDSLALLRSQSPEDQKLIREVLDTITSGQELDLKRFGGVPRIGEHPTSNERPLNPGTTSPQPSDSLAPARSARSGPPPPADSFRRFPSNSSPPLRGGEGGEISRSVGVREESSLPEVKIVALKTDAELDDYTYRVAGCVGEFWTRICVAHQFSSLEILGFTHLTDSFFEELGVRFGKGLQLVNVLRDIPADLRKGRCYVPLEKLEGIGLSPADLMRPENEARFRPLYNHYLDRAEAHLEAGWKYTNLIPFGQIRVRLACAWPILIGLKTISRLRSGNMLDPAQRIKISRGELRQIMVRSVAFYPIPGVWQGLAKGKAQ